MNSPPLSAIDHPELWQRFATLLWSDIEWIYRRKEAITILDDTALRRRVSVDLATVKLAFPVDGSDDVLFAAPAFVLPKSASSLMAFDLIDAQGGRLALSSMRDNRELSGRVLCEMATLVLGRPPSRDLSARLLTIAAGDPREAGLTFRRMLEGSLPTISDCDIDALKTDRRFCWWLTTLSHSSIVPVCFRGPPTLRRTLLKVEYQQPFAREPRLLSHLGLTPFQVGVDLPWIEACDFHVEVIAPEGLRLLSADLIDDEMPDGQRQKGFLRRVHLVRERAQAAGAGTVILELIPNTQIFVGGAVTAAILSLLALGSCWYGASAIAAYPTSAPSLLLLIPAVLASYVSRPTVHPLTARMLSSARKLLALIALLAYVAAASVALSGPTPHNPVALHERTEYLQIMLGVLTLLSVGPTVLLLFSFARSQPKWRATWADLVGGVWWERQRRVRFSATGYLRVRPDQLKAQLFGADAGVRLLARRSRRVPLSRPSSTFAVLERARLWIWLIEFEVEQVWQGTQLTITGTIVGPRLLRRWSGGAVRRRHARLARGLQALEASLQREDQAGIQPSANSWRIDDGAQRPLGEEGEPG